MRTDSSWVLRARPIAAYHTDDVSILVQISAVAAFLVFVAGCMSAANLVLARLASRRHARHLLTESVLLALVAGGAGTVLAQWGVHALRDAIPKGFFGIRSGVGS